MPVAVPEIRREVAIPYSILYKFADQVLSVGTGRRSETYIFF